MHGYLRFVFAERPRTATLVWEIERCVLWFYVTIRRIIFPFLKCHAPLPNFTIQLKERVERNQLKSNKHWWAITCKHKHGETEYNVSLWLWVIARTLCLYVPIIRIWKHWTPFRSNKTRYTSKQEQLYVSWLQINGFQMFQECMCRRANYINKSEAICMSTSENYMLFLWKVCHYALNIRLKAISEILDAKVLVHIPSNEQNKILFFFLSQSKTQVHVSGKDGIKMKYLFKLYLSLF